MLKHLSRYPFLQKKIKAKAGPELQKSELAKQTAPNKKNPNFRQDFNFYTKLNIICQQRFRMVIPRLHHGANEHLQYIFQYV